MGFVAFVIKSVTGGATGAMTGLTPGVTFEGAGPGSGAIGKVLRPAAWQLLTGHVSQFHCAMQGYWDLLVQCKHL